MISKLLLSDICGAAQFCVDTLNVRWQIILMSGNKVVLHSAITSACACLFLHQMHRDVDGLARDYYLLLPIVGA